MKIELPHVGESVTEGVIGKWLKQVGDTVRKYDPLVEVVTDKVNMEMPAPASGVLTSILAEEGATVPMGAVIAEMRVEGEQDVPSTPEAIDRTGVLLKDTAPVGPTGSAGPVSAPQEQTDAPAHRPRYSPAVQRLADEHGVALSDVAGTGIGDRVTRKDVQAHIDSALIRKPPEREAPEEADVPTESKAEERVPLTPIRRIIADNMVKSASQIPQAWSLVEVDVTGLVRRREPAKADFLDREGVNLTYLSFVIEAVAQALKENPLVNASWGGDSIILKRRFNIGVAVAAPGGLVVPVIHDADALSIAGLAKAVARLTDKARLGKLALEDVQGGTFTVNNTGALGSVVSKPLVNSPQAAIVTTEAIVKRPVAVNDAIAIRSMMNICLAFDHRVLDGAEASAFIETVKRLVEAIGPDTAIY